MIEMDFKFSAKLWLYKADKASWHFVTVPEDISKDIKAFTKHLSSKRGFQSVRVNVTMGQSQWSTSIFPDKESGCYLLPIKAEIRKAECLSLDQAATIKLNIPL